MIGCKDEIVNSTHEQTDHVPSARVIYVDSLHDSLRITPVSLRLPPSVTKFTPLSRSGIPWISTHQLVNEPAGRHLFTFYGTDHGLPIETINALLVDRRGVLWIGTGAGLCRYTGDAFQTFTTQFGLSSNYITSLTEDASGGIWIGTGGGGINYFDGFSFSSFEHIGLEHAFINAIAEDMTGSVWITTRGDGIWNYRDGQFVKKDIEIPVHSNYTSVQCDAKGNVWIGIMGKGLLRYDGAQWSEWSTGNGMPDIRINSLLVDRKDRIWIGSVNGISRFDGKEFDFFPISAQDEPGNVFALFEDVSGMLWLGTERGGVFKFDGDRFTNYNVRNGFSNEKTVALYGDRQGSLWIGTEGAGLFRYDGNGLIAYTSAHGVGDYIFTALADSNALWFGSQLGLSRVCRDTSVTFSYENGFVADNIYDLSRDKAGNMWIASFNGLIRFDGHQFFTYAIPQGLPSNAVCCVFPDAGNRVWAGLYDGGAFYLQGKEVVAVNQSQGLAGNIVRSITSDSSGVTWFGTERGLSRFDGTTITNYTTAHGLSHNYIINLHFDSFGNLWVGTDGGGINRFDGESFISFQTAHGLPDISATGVSLQKDGLVLIGTNQGLAMLKSFRQRHTGEFIPAQNNKSNVDLSKYDPVIEKYSSVNGFPIKDVNWGQTSMAQDEKGINWIGTGSSGLIRFDARELKKPEAVEVVLKNIRINNHEVPWNFLDPHNDKKATQRLRTEEVLKFGTTRPAEDRDSIYRQWRHIAITGIDSFYPVPQGLTLPYDQNNVTFSYGAIAPAWGKSLRYEVKLEGYDSEWQDGRLLANTYGNIREGYYRFLLRAAIDQQAFGEPLVFAFRVLPPWHRTWWAYTLYAALVLLVLYGWYHLHRRRTLRQLQLQVEKQQLVMNERLRISRDLHDEVGSTLSGIVMYSHLAKQQGEAQADNNQYLDVVQETASAMVSKLNDVVWLVNPKQDTLAKLLERLDDFGQQLCASRHIRFEMKKSINRDLQLPIETKKNIYLICKEAINNAVKYSQATTITLDALVDVRGLRILIADDGIGFTPGSVKRGNGLNSMEERARLIGGQYHLVSVEQQGTSIELTCPLP